MAGMFMKPEVMAIFGLIVGIISFVLIALIVTAITQKKNPETGALDG